MTRFWRGLVLIFFLFLSFLVSPLPAVENPLQKVFVLHSFHRGYKWTDDQNAGIVAALKEAIGPNQIYIEYMDNARMHYDRAFRDLLRVYQIKYHGLKFDCICVTDANALRFMLKYRDRLFPGTPVVFSGVNVAGEPELKKARNFTGVNMEADLKANMDLILKLHPRTRHIVFINEWTTKGYPLHEEFLRISPLFGRSIQFVLLEDVDTKEIFRVLGALPPHSVVLYGVFSRDKAGRQFDYDEILSLLSRNSHAPIYSPWDFNLGHGIVGGEMTTGSSQGKAAGMQALRILRGGRVRYIPVERTASKRTMFDYDQLKRFKIGMNQLPAESMVLNYPKTFYQRHKKLIITALAVSAALLAVISILLINIQFRRRTETALKASQEQLRGLGWRLSETEEKGRKALSRELHDQIGQNLTILGVNLNLFKSMIPRDTPSLVHSRITDSIALVKQTTERVRNLMSDLRSPVLDDYGLVAALDLYAKQWGIRTGIGITVRGQGPELRFAPQVENALFRIVQEALTNVVKHAQAEAVVVTVSVTEGKVTLSVEDNGIGYDTASAAHWEAKGGWGMMTMKERALAVGGTFQVKSGREIGTQVVVEVPF
jgi:signal transduction histidine kinase